MKCLCLRSLVCDKLRETGISKTELSKRVGVNSRTLYKHLSGECKISLQSARLYLEFLGLDYEEFMK